MRTMLRCFVLFCAFGSLLACGGGTTGTGDVSGGRITRIVGEVRNSASGEVVSGTLVTVQETGDSAVTDAEGAFFIETTLVDSSASLVVRGTDFDSTVELGDIPPQDATVKVTLIVNELDNIVTVASISISVNSEESQVKPESATPIQQQDTSPETSSSDSDQQQEEDSPDSVVKGTVLFDDGSAAVGAEVRILQTGDRDHTNRHGRFRIESTSLPERITLRVAFEGAKGSVSISGIPRRHSVEIRVVLVLHQPDAGAGGLPGPSIDGELDVTAESVEID